MKKMKIHDKMYDVTTLREYMENRDAYIPGYTAIQEDHTGIVLPVKSKTDTGVGIYVGDSVAYSTLPEDSDEYDSNNIIDMDNIDSMKELMERQQAVRDLEMEILTSPDNIFSPTIFDDDSPEMKALKKAVLDKHIDLDKYEPRFGSNYANDKRLFNKHTISLAMTKRICNALDIEATLILDNKSGNVPNPMHEPIVVKLTGGDDDEEQ